MTKNTKNTESDNPSVLEIIIALTLAVAIVVGLPAAIGALIGGITGAFLGGAIAIGVFIAGWSINKKVQAEMYYSKPVSDIDERDGLKGNVDNGWGPDPSSAPASINRDQNLESESDLGKPAEPNSSNSSDNIDNSSENAKNKPPKLK